MNTLQKNGQTIFHTLAHETIINLVENSLGTPCTNLCRPLNSYINRVYELQTEEGGGIIAKFYRPGRWSRTALQDEHDFLLELAEQEIPVVAPLILSDNTSLGTLDNITFALFPKKGGRSFDEFNDDQWLELGRLLGRTHAAGALRTAGDRIIMTPATSTRQQLDFILQGDFMTPDLAKPFKDVSENLIQEISHFFEKTELIRIHGDCHFANLIYRPDESFYLIDFDDMAVGPPVQDVWMLLPGHVQDCLVEIDIFLEGYETFRHFDRQSLRLVEPLRAMRYIHYIAWCAHQVAEDGLSTTSPDFGSAHYWQIEIFDLVEQLDRIRCAPEQLGNLF